MKTKLLSLLVVPFFFLAGCGKDNATGTNPATEKAITDIRDISQAPDRRVHVGKKVEIVSAVVAGRPLGNFIFLVGDKNSKVPVVRMDKMKAPVTKHVKDGSIVNLTGTVRLLSEVGATDRMWEGINPAERATINSEFVYIAADVVQIAQ